MIINSTTKKCTYCGSDLHEENGKHVCEFCGQEYTAEDLEYIADLAAER